LIRKIGRGKYPGRGPGQVGVIDTDSRTLHNVDCYSTDIDGQRSSNGKDPEAT